MRIAHVITRMILGGAQENTLQCCRDLMRDYDDEVLLITGPAEGPEGSLIEEATAAGVPVKIIPSLRRAIHPVDDLRAYRALGRALEEFQPQVVHTHSAKGGFLGRLAAWRWGARAVVHTVHGAPFHPYQSAQARAVFRGCERYAAARCHRLVSVSDAMTELLVGAGVAPRDKFTTVYSGFDVEAYLAADQWREQLRSEYGFTEDQVVVGKIARLFRLKGHEDLIAAARPLVEKHPQVRFLLVGNGELRPRLERRIEQGGLSDYFRFAGLVPPARIPALIGAMDIVVHASLREGLARALPQALVAGRPVVSYDVDGAREVVLPEETGMLVPPRSVDGLVAALGRLVEDADLRSRLGQRGRELCTERFRHEHMTRALREIYTEILSERREDSHGA